MRFRAATRAPGEPRVTGSPFPRPVLGLPLLNGLGSAACATLLGLGVRHSFDRLVRGSHNGSELYVLIGVGFVIAAAGSGWLRARERVDAERLGQHYVHSLRMALYDRLAAMSPRMLQRRSSGGVMLRFVGDLSQIRMWVSLGLARLVVGATTCAGALAALAVLNVVLAVAVAVVLAFGTAAAMALGGPLRERVRRARRRRVRLAANIS